MAAGRDEPVVQSDHRLTAILICVVIRETGLSRTTDFGPREVASAQAPAGPAHAAVDRLGISAAERRLLPREVGQVVDAGGSRRLRRVGVETGVGLRT